MKKIIFYLSLCFILSSCVIKFSKKVELKIENESSLEAYLNEFEIGTEHLYAMNNFPAFMEFSKNMGLTDIFFFNSDGYLVENQSDKNCSIAISEIEKVNSYEIKKIEKTDELSDQNNIKIDYWLKHIRPVKQNLKDTETEKEYTVIISWAKFIGKYNKQSFKWYKELKNSPSYAKVNVIFLNLDVQEDWELTQENKDLLGIE